MELDAKNLVMLDARSFLEFKIRERYTDKQGVSHYIFFVMKYNYNYFRKNVMKYHYSLHLYF